MNQHGYSNAAGDLKLKGATPGVAKYDCLTALMLLAAHASPIEGRLASRLALLITSRYNWQRRCFHCGVRELARLWAVTERTAKREVALLKSMGWIQLQRSAARGRVAQYGINFEILFGVSKPFWHAVGPDFVERMTQPEKPAATNVVMFPNPEFQHSGDEASVWLQVSKHLFEQSPQIHQAWFSALQVVAETQSEIVLQAPSTFHRDYVLTHHATVLADAFRVVSQRVFVVDVVSGS